MPVFRLSDAPVFPDVALAEPEGLLAVGGDLSPERLLAAYQHGIFPWYNEGEPILWWSPPERAVIFPEHAHFSHSLRKTLRKGGFLTRLDTCFSEVIAACASAKRQGQRGTWISPEMQQAYMTLHERGFAHSVEAFFEGTLIGGLYGVSLGGCFFGESMFSRASDGSKVAFFGLCQRLVEWKFDLVDCQLENENVRRYGAETISRRRFMEILHRSLQRPTRAGSWTTRTSVSRY